MHRLLRTTVCRILIALTVWTPFQMAQASMLGTEQAVQSTAQLDRAHVLGMLEREDVTSQLQLYGIDPAQAKDRVAAMSDQEVSSLAQQIDALPAGGLHGAGAILLLLIIAGVVWWVVTKSPGTR
jgi:hypothetical protein